MCIFSLCACRCMFFNSGGTLRQLTSSVEVRNVEMISVTSSPWCHGCWVWQKIWSRNQHTVSLNWPIKEQAFLVTDTCHLLWQVPAWSMAMVRPFITESSLVQSYLTLTVIARLINGKFVWKIWGWLPLTEKASIEGTFFARVLNVLTPGSLRTCLCKRNFCSLPAGVAQQRPMVNGLNLYCAFQHLHGTPKCLRSAFHLPMRTYPYTPAGDCC